MTLITTINRIDILPVSILPIRIGRQINSKWCRIKVVTKGLLSRVPMKCNLMPTCNSNIPKCMETIILTQIAFIILRINFRVRTRSEWDNRALQIWTVKIAISNSREPILTPIISHYLLILEVSTIKIGELVGFQNRNLYQVYKGRQALQWEHRSNNILLPSRYTNKTIITCANSNNKRINWRKIYLTFILHR
jgi:hypothetical protein